MEQSKPKGHRCAIYTRKSSEEGLEQDFNSLHAQREACEAFIKSQASEGWKLDLQPPGELLRTIAPPRIVAGGHIRFVVVHSADRQIANYKRGTPAATC
jgi:site-specific DNA recombinase